MSKPRRSIKYHEGSFVNDNDRQNWDDNPHETRDIFLVLGAMLLIMAVINQVF